MVVQLHRQNLKTLKSEMVAQGAFSNQREYEDWLWDLQSRHTLGESETWMVCTEDSPDFVRVKPAEHDPAPGPPDPPRPAQRKEFA